MEQSTTTKVCTRCGKELPLTAFYRKPKGKFGCTSECRECHKMQVRKYQDDKRRVQVTSPSPTHIKRNPKFDGQTPRELQQKMRELKEELIARGFNCEVKLTYLNEIKI